MKTAQGARPCGPRSPSYVLAKFTNPISICDCANRSELLLLSQRQPHPRGDDRERVTRARQAAEALFTATPTVRTPSVPDTAPADQSVRRPRVLRITSPSPARHDEAENPVAPEPLAREIPRSQFGRIRTLARYGMTVAQVADVYGVAVGEIERIIRRI